MVTRSGGTTRRRRAVVALLLVLPATAGCGRPSGAGPALSGTTGPGIGEPARDGMFEFTVLGVRCGVARVEAVPPPQGRFCLVDIRVRNVGTEPRTVWSGAQDLYAGDRRYDADDRATLAVAPPGRQLWILPVNPGNSVDGELAFDVPPGTRPDRVRLHDSAFSGGVDVRLGHGD